MMNYVQHPEALSYAKYLAFMPLLVYVTIVTLMVAIIAKVFFGG